MEARGWDSPVPSGWEQTHSWKTGIALPGVSTQAEHKSASGFS